jgi:hypothetical protein
MCFLKSACVLCDLMLNRLSVSPKLPVM